LKERFLCSDARGSTEVASPSQLRPPNAMLPRVVLLGLAQQASAGQATHDHGYRSSEPWIPKENVGPAVAAEILLAEQPLPSSLDYRNLNGQNMVVSDWNQHIPNYCGSCWIHGTLSALSDRIKLMRNGQFPDVRLGRQSILNCVPDPEGKGPPPGCHGGSPDMIHKYMYENKVPDESCMPYQGVNMGCQADTVCRNCAKGKGCWAVPEFIGYGVSSYGFVSGEQAMMQEIFARGPIACSFATDDPWMFNYSENVVRHDGVYVTKQKKTANDIDHIMEVAGWGETPAGLKYWVIRNSWGTYWGEAGWAKLERGVNALMVESSCAWAVPTWDGLDEALPGHTLGSYTVGQQPSAAYGGLAEWSAIKLGSSGTVLATAGVSAFVMGALAAFAVQAPRYWRVRVSPRLLG